MQRQRRSRTRGDATANRSRISATRKATVDSQGADTRRRSSRPSGCKPAGRSRTPGSVGEVEDRTARREATRRWSSSPIEQETALRPVDVVKKASVEFGNAGSMPRFRVDGLDRLADLAKNDRRNSANLEQRVIGRGSQPGKQSKEPAFSVAFPWVFTHHSGFGGICKHYHTVEKKGGWTWLRFHARIASE